MVKLWTPVSKKSKAARRARVVAERNRCRNLGIPAHLPVSSHLAFIVFRAHAVAAAVRAVAEERARAAHMAEAESDYSLSQPGYVLTDGELQPGAAPRP
jgi:hypothetical protein